MSIEYVQQAGSGKLGHACQLPRHAFTPIVMNCGIVCHSTQHSYGMATTGSLKPRHQLVSDSSTCLV
jgi:hypothetical protein